MSCVNFIIFAKHDVETGRVKVFMQQSQQIANVLYSTYFWPPRAIILAAGQNNGYRWPGIRFHWPEYGVFDRVWKKPNIKLILYLLA